MKFILLPLSWLFGLLTSIRNKLYDKGIFKSYHSHLKTIVIGNLQAGGAGKTPQTAYLYEYLSTSYKTAILSRGYGRKTNGLIEANEQTTADNIGDEPLWYKRNFKDARVVVSEKREAGLQYLEKLDTELVLLDDAYQHRAILGDIYLLLTDYNTPYFKDYPLPFGRLREYRAGYKRADIIIVTKCPETLSFEAKIGLIQAINPGEHQHVFFTSIVSGKPQALKGETDFLDINYNNIITMSGIANPESFISLCRQFKGKHIPMNFKDHHDYTMHDIRKLIGMIGNDTIVMTTEKDAVKLSDKKIFDLLPENKIFVMPIKTFFLFDEESRMKYLVKELLGRIKYPLNSDV